MSDHLHILFTPLLPAALLQVMAALAALLLAYALMRRVRGAAWRGCFFALLLLILANPSLIEEQREPIKDIALVVVDDSSSMQIGDRSAQTQTALDALDKKLSAFPDLDVETLHVKGTVETDLFRTTEQKLASIPRDRLAGVIALTDGQINDKPRDLPGPFHALIAGHKNEIDRRLIVKQAPAYGLVGKNATLTLRIEDEPKAQSDSATVTLRQGKSEGRTVTLPVGQDVSFEVPVDHAGQNLFVFSTETLPDEITPINNMAAVSINGIRDHLRVLLVSGQPHIGGRTWRNFLKADPAVDLIHFTILRSPVKFDTTPNNQMSLIAFPVHELFDAKLQSFDLVILDRFRQQSLVPDEYLENIAKYVEKGGALLVSSATDEGIPPLTFSPLARVLPTTPTGKLLTGSFVPALTDAGKRHPVTDTLANGASHGAWGPWFRQIDSRVNHGDVLMSGLDGKPLLVLDRVGQGRVAQFLSDQFWLWAHDYKGGGPQAELLRRIAHWLVQEPELEENALRARAENTDAAGTKGGWQLFITKQSLHQDSDVVTVTDPQNRTSQITLVPGAQPGVLTATMEPAQPGLYQLKDADQEALVMAGSSDAPEFGEMRATAEKLAPFVSASGGAIDWLQDHPHGPDIRRTAPRGTQQGWNWIGLRQNGQYRITGSKAYPLLPPWLCVVLLLAFAMEAWRREGRG